MKNSLSDVFKALGDPTRIKIFKLLAFESKNLCVGALAESLGITQPAVSQHLKILKNVGILESKRMGFHVHYRINKETLSAYKSDINSLLSNAIENNKKIDPCKTCPASVKKKK